MSFTFEMKGKLGNIEVKSGKTGKAYFLANILPDGGDGPIRMISWGEPEGLKKGMKVMARGEISMRKWENEETGVVRYYPNFRAEDIRPWETPAQNTEFDDDSIPF